MALKGSPRSDLWFRTALTVGERVKETGKPGREEAATIGSQRGAGPVFVLSLPDSVTWGELTSWSCSSTSVRWG